MSKTVGNQLRKFYSHLSTKRRQKAVKADLARVRKNTNLPGGVKRDDTIGEAMLWAATPEGWRYWHVRHGFHLKGE